MNTSELVDQYINSKSLAWAKSSQRNERHRLKFHASKVFEDPKIVYGELKKRMKDHSIKTTFTRLGQFHEWLVANDKIPPTKTNPWKQFLKDHAMIFKHCYQIERVKLTFEEAKQRIETLEGEYRLASLQLLEGGLRYCELWTFDGERVIGKGNKPRRVFFREELKNFRWRGSYSALYVRLKAIGLKPHSLRKLCATEFSRHPQVKDQDICKTFGWSSIETSIKYRQAFNDDRLSEMLQSVVNKAKIETTIKSLVSKLIERVKITQ